MPAPNSSTQRTHALALLQRRGMTRLAEFNAAGITATTVSRMEMELLLTRYALERLLHRLSLSPHRERFVLKGAMLLATWFDEPHRATRDVDLLGFGDASADALLATFRESDCAFMTTRPPHRPWFAPLAPRSASVPG